MTHWHLTIGELGIISPALVLTGVVITQWTVRHTARQTKEGQEAVAALTLEGQRQLAQDERMWSARSETYVAALRHIGTMQMASTEGYGWTAKEREKFLKGGLELGRLMAPIMAHASDDVGYAYGMLMGDVGRFAKTLQGFETAPWDQMTDEVREDIDGAKLEIDRKIANLRELMRKDLQKSPNK